LGKEIYEKICADCWREWIAMGTKVINELRLPLSDPQAQKIFDQHMKEFLNL
jgi:Fe-S cluster biosynthesis and repair protein YggX